MQTEEKIEVKKDCFAYREKKDPITKVVHCNCNALHELYCKVENCNFYKSKV